MVEVTDIVSYWIMASSTWVKSFQGPTICRRQCHLLSYPEGESRSGLPTMEGQAVHQGRREPISTSTSKAAATLPTAAALSVSPSGGAGWGRAPWRFPSEPYTLAQIIQGVGRKGGSSKPAGPWVCQTSTLGCMFIRSPSFPVILCLLWGLPRILLEISLGGLGHRPPDSPTGASVMVTAFANCLCPRLDFRDARHAQDRLVTSHYISGAQWVQADLISLRVHSRFCLWCQP